MNGGEVDAGDLSRRVLLAEFAVLWLEAGHMLPVFMGSHCPDASSGTHVQYKLPSRVSYFYDIESLT